MITPIYSRLKEYCNVSSRFHTPGHSGVNIDDTLYNCANMDITELSFSDNLACPEGIIKQAEELMAEQYSCNKTLFLTNGGSGAIFIALSIMKNYGEKIVVGQNAHISIHRAARLLGLNIVLADDQHIIASCDKEENIGGVIITTPDYYGNTIYCDELRDYLKSKDIIFAIDHSHGMHYVYSDLLPESMADKADIVIGSLHKTLPVMTGGAILIINREDLYDLALYHRMNIHTTSPSYLILASMDFARGYITENGERLYDSLFKRVDMIQDELNGTRYSIARSDDFTRLVIDFGKGCGYSAQRELEKRGIFPEMADNNRVVFILTPFNADKITRLVREIREIKIDKESFDSICYKPLRIEDYMGKEIEFVSIENSLGRVAGSEIAIYPPSVSLLRSGDIIDNKIIDMMLKNRKYIIGLVKGLVPVIK